ncbi:MAG: helix-turn-helix domain-containing protein [Pseudanabaena sp.]
MEDLTEFIESTPPSRELKRAIAVQMVQQNMTYESIAKMLCVSTSFVGKWKQALKKKELQVSSLNIRDRKHI